MHYGFPLISPYAKEIRHAQIMEGSVTDSRTVPSGLPRLGKPKSVSGIMYHARRIVIYSLAPCSTTFNLNRCTVCP